MSKYLVCICGWVSEEYPDSFVPVGFGGTLDCPMCHAQLRNATLEMCYGNVEVITDVELADLRKQESQGIQWEQAFRNLMRKKLQTPVLLTTPFNTEPPEDDFNATMWEDEEDTLRKRKHKSIRYGGKYKGRHHGSKKKDA